MSGIELVSGDRYPHGTRARYVSAKCRCAECRRSNREYARTRAHAESNGLIDASPARAHMLGLSAAGVGKRAVASASDVALTVLEQVRSGKSTRVRANTLKRILAVDVEAASDHAHVPAKATSAALRELQRLGLTKQEIATRLGSQAKTPALRLSFSRVTALNAMKVRRLLLEVRGEVALEKTIDICASCGESHASERRLAWLTKIDADLADIIDARPCWYGGSAGERLLYRDRATLREQRAE